MTIGEVEVDLWIIASTRDHLLVSVLVVVIHLVYLDRADLGTIELDGLVVGLLIPHDMEGRRYQQIVLLVGIDDGLFSFRPFHHVVFQLHRCAVDNLGAAADIGNLGIHGIDEITLQFGLADVSDRDAIEVVNGFPDASFSLGTLVRLGQRHLDDELRHLLWIVFPVHGITVGGNRIVAIAAVGTLEGVAHVAQGLRCVLTEEGGGGIEVLETPSRMPCCIARHLNVELGDDLGGSPAEASRNVLSSSGCHQVVARTAHQELFVWIGCGMVWFPNVGIHLCLAC